MEKLDLIVNLLNDNRADVKEIKEDLSDMKVDVALNKEDLKTHMAQTKAVKELIIKVETAHNERLEKVENNLTLGHLLKLIITGASGIAAVTGAIYGVIRLLS